MIRSSTAYRLGPDFFLVFFGRIIAILESPTTFKKRGEERLSVLYFFSNSGLISGRIFRHKLQIVPSRILKRVGINERSVILHVNNLTVQRKKCVRLCLALNLHVWKKRMHVRNFQ